MPYTEAQVDRLIQSNSELSASVRSLARALHGEPKEGNPGLLTRVSKLEAGYQRYRWSVPVSIFLGLAGGQGLTVVLSRLVS